MTRASSVLLGLFICLGSARAAGATEPDATPPSPSTPPAMHDEAGPDALATSPTVPPPAPVVHDDPRSPRTLQVGAALTGTGAALGISAGILTHVALTPPCGDIDDILQCELPTASDLLGRRTMIGLGGTFALGGAVIGGLGGGRLARGLALTATDANRERRRRLVTGIGAGTLSLGLAQAVAGVTMVGMGVTRAVAPVDLTDGSPEQDQRQRDQIVDRLRDVKVARSGLAMVLVAPTLIATGAAMLYRRKAFRPRRMQASFAASSSTVGLVLSGRF